MDAVDPQDLAIGLSHVFERLKKLGYRIDFKQQLEGRRLPVEALNGYELAIDGDGFLVYRFEKPASASEFSAWHGHSRSAGPFVFRSDPPGQYKAAGLETNNQPDESIEWSSLLEDDEFARALESIVAPMYPSLSGS